MKKKSEWRRIITVTFGNAKKLHNGDEVIIKESNAPATVIGTRVSGKIVWILCVYEGYKEFQHTEVK